MEREGALVSKSLAFSVRIVKLCRLLNERDKAYPLTNQLIRSGTAVGAMVHESVFAQSKPDFINKLSVALKEANETAYWLLLLRRTDYIDDREYASIEADCKELLRMLIASIRTAKESLQS